MMKMTRTPILIHPVCLDGGIKREWKEWRKQRKKENQWIQRFPSKPVKIGQFLMIRLSIKRNPQRLVGPRTVDKCRFSANYRNLSQRSLWGYNPASNGFSRPDAMLWRERYHGEQLFAFPFSMYTSKHQMTSLSFHSQEALETFRIQQHDSNEKIKITICLIKQNYNLHLHHSFLYISLLFAN